MGKYDGQTFGEWTIISGTRAGTLAQCSCGSDPRYVNCYQVRSGGYKACMDCRDRRERAGAGTPESYGRSLVFACYRTDATRRGLSFELTPEQLMTIIKSECFYCGDVDTNTRVVNSKKKFRFSYNGIDRVDSSQGYTLNNVVAACRFCNYAKRDRSAEEFDQWIKRLVARRNRTDMV